MIEKVIRIDNDMVMLFKENGGQIPEKFGELMNS